MLKLITNALEFIGYLKPIPEKKSKYRSQPVLRNGKKVIITHRGWE
jgi:hypothetical protein